MAAATGHWDRVGRAAVCRCRGRGRYGSVAATAAGELLVLFTCGPETAGAAAAAELVLCRSGDGGRTWSAPLTVRREEGGEPRAAGTMTRLRSGTILAPYVLWPQQESPSVLHLLASEDGGLSWTVSKPISTTPCVWLQPTGRLLEEEDGTLVMPVHAARSESELTAAIHGCALLRSRDRGRTWNEFRWVVQGRQPVHGADPDRLFSFEAPTIAALPDGRWLAAVTARRLNRAGEGPSAVDEGPGSPELVCRVSSCDRGQTWTQPDQLAPGAWPGLAAVGPDTFLVTTHWAAWGTLHMSVSADALETFHQQLPVYEQGWLRGRLNRPQEIPLPPTVPRLGRDWATEHYGFPSLLSPGPDRLVVVLNRPQRGEPQIEGPDTLALSPAWEMIEAVFYERTGTAPKRRSTVTRSRCTTPRARWVLTERFRTALTGPVAQAPDGTLVGPINGSMSRSADGGRSWEPLPNAAFPAGETAPSVFGILRNGRWLVATLRQDGPATEGTAVSVGVRGGYPVFRSAGWDMKCQVAVSRSDDAGRTWATGQPFRGPLLWAMPAASHFLEFDDGSLGLPLYGCVTEDEADSYSSSNCIVRSTDRGANWGDASFVFRTNPRGPDDLQCEPRFTEMDVIRRPDGRLIAFSRNEYMIMGPKGWGTTEVAESRDGGRTWKRTGASLVGVSQQSGLSLPDGGIALTYRSHSWQQPGVAVSYDEGRSVRYEMGGPYETFNAFVTAPDEFVVFTALTHRSDGSAAAYRRVGHAARHAAGETASPPDGSSEPRS